MEELEKQALRSCCSALVQLLDISAVLPHLIAKQMLTVENRYFLTCESKSQQEKAEYLVYILPRKCKGWFVRFLNCLQLSTEGTAHADLAQKLKVQLDDLKEINASKQKSVGECAAANEVAMACSGGREEIYNIFLESSDGNVYTINIKSTESVDALVEKICHKLNIAQPVKIKLVDWSQRLHERRVKKQ